MNYGELGSEGAKKYADAVGEKVAREGFKVEVEDDRSILETAGQEKIEFSSRIQKKLQCNRNK